MVRKQWSKICRVYFGAGPGEVCVVSSLRSPNVNMCHTAAFLSNEERRAGVWPQLRFTRHEQRRAAHIAPHVIGQGSFKRHVVEQFGARGERRASEYTARTEKPVVSEWQAISAAAGAVARAARVQQTRAE